MKNYKLFAFTNEEKEAISKKARNLGVVYGIGALRRGGEFVYIYTKKRIVRTGIYYKYFKIHQNVYISVHDFLALPESKFVQRRIDIQLMERVGK